MNSKIMTTRFKDPADYRATGELAPYFTNRIKTGITSTLSQTYRFSCIETGINIDYKQPWFAYIPIVNVWLDEESYHTIDIYTYDFIPDGTS